MFASSNSCVFAGKHTGHPVLLEGCSPRSKCHYLASLGIGNTYLARQYGLPNTVLTALVGWLVGWLVKPETLQVLSHLWLHWLNGLPDTHLTALVGWLVKPETLQVLSYLWLHWLNGLPDTHLTALVSWLVKPETLQVLSYISLVALAERIT